MANEKRLIDANALGIGKAKREVFDNPAYADGWNSAIAIIENAPAVDAVEVVRCKDCYSYCPETNDRPICISWGSWTDPDGWCYKGERREGE